MVLGNLPPELQLIVIDYLSIGTYNITNTLFYNLCLVSKASNRIFTPHLYSFVDLTRGGGLYNPDTKEIEPYQRPGKAEYLLLRSFSQGRELAKMVKEFHFSGPSKDCTLDELLTMLNAPAFSDVRYYPERVYDETPSLKKVQAWAFECLLYQMTALEVLHFRHGSIKTNFPLFSARTFGGFIAENRFPRFKTLSISMDIDDSYNPRKDQEEYEGDLDDSTSPLWQLRYLCRAPSIENLIISTGYLPYSLSGVNDCRNLKSLYLEAPAGLEKSSVRNLLYENKNIESLGLVNIEFSESPSTSIPEILDMFRDLSNAASCLKHLRLDLDVLAPVYDLRAFAALQTLTISLVQLGDVMNSEDVDTEMSRSKQFCTELGTSLARHLPVSVHQMIFSDGCVDHALPILAYFLEEVGVETRGLHLRSIELREDFDPRRDPFAIDNLRNIRNIWDTQLSKYRSVRKPQVLCKDKKYLREGALDVLSYKAETMNMELVIERMSESWYDALSNEAFADWFDILTMGTTLPFAGPACLDEEDLIDTDADDESDKDSVSQGGIGVIVDGDAKDGD